MSVVGGMRVEDMNIKVGSFEPTSPETVGSDIKTYTILREGFSSIRLQFGLNADITTYFSVEVGTQIPDFVVSYGGEATLWARETMFYRKFGTACTC